MKYASQRIDTWTPDNLKPGHMVNEDGEMARLIDNGRSWTIHSALYGKIASRDASYIASWLNQFGAIWDGDL